MHSITWLTCRLTTTLILLTSVSFGTIWGGGSNMHFYRLDLWTVHL